MFLQIAEKWTKWKNRWDDKSKKEKWSLQGKLSTWREIASKSTFIEDSSQNQFSRLKWFSFKFNLLKLALKIKGQILDANCSCEMNMSPTWGFKGGPYFFAPEQGGICVGLILNTLQLPWAIQSRDFSLRKLFFTVRRNCFGDCTFLKKVIESFKIYRWVCL